MLSPVASARTRVVTTTFLFLPITSTMCDPVSPKSSEVRLRTSINPTSHQQTPKNSQEEIVSLEPRTKVPRLENADTSTTLHELGPVNVTNYSFVFFKLETGSLEPESSDILEIAARFPGLQFYMYVQPTRAISSGATEINHLDCVDGKLRYRSQEVTSFPIRKVLAAFIKFLENVKSLTEKPVILFTHNVPFSARFLSFNLIQEKLDEEFKETVHGFVDTLPAFKDLSTGLNQHSLNALFKQYLRCDVAHRAKIDVKNLEVLFFTGLNNQVNDFSKYFQTFLQSCEPLKRMLSFEDMVRKNVISNYMASVLGKYGYDLPKLQLIFESEGEKGVKRVFQERIGTGLPRVTASDHVLKMTVDYLDDLQFGDLFQL